MAPLDGPRAFRLVAAGRLNLRRFEDHLCLCGPDKASMKNVREYVTVCRGKQPDQRENRGCHKDDGPAGGKIIVVGDVEANDAGGNTNGGAKAYRDQQTVRKQTCSSSRG